jgi:hypothetical protein
MDDLANLSEQDIMQLMELGIIPPQLEDLKQQMSIAQSLRDREAPGGTYAGRVYVADSPLKHAAYAMQGIKAGRDIDKARLEQQKLLAKQVAGRGMFFNKYRQPGVDPQLQNDVDMAY